MEFESAYRDAREWHARGMHTPYARPGSATERGWNAGLRDGRMVMSSAALDTRIRQLARADRTAR